MKIPSTVILLISIVQARRERRAVFDLITDNHTNLITDSQKNLITKVDNYKNNNIVLSQVLQNKTEITFEYLSNMFSKKLKEKKGRRRSKNRREGMKKQFLERGNQKPRIQKQNKLHSTLNLLFLTKLS